VTLDWSARKPMNDVVIETVETVFEDSATP
jgi:hypothetical protein